MTKIRILTAGESHGKCLIGILEGLPAGLSISKDRIDADLKRRQAGFGRGSRMKIESDRVEVLSGLRFRKTLGSPVAVLIENRDWKNWKERMAVWETGADEPVTIPRPGHADLAGVFKYGFSDIRNVLERASARETAVRVALGSIARQFLENFGIWIGSQVIQIHRASTEKTFRNLFEKPFSEIEGEIQDLCRNAENSETRCGDPEAAKKMMECIRLAAEKGDSVGGLFEVAAVHVPIGLGTYTSADRRLDARIAEGIMSIPAVKAAEIGLGIESGFRLGSEMHDPIVPSSNQCPNRSSNRAGGIEGGISNGEPILIRAAMKPIPTLTQPLPSVDLATGKPVSAFKERSDVCAVPSASVVAESVLALILLDAFCEKFGGDSMDEILRHFDGYKNSLKR